MSYDLDQCDRHLASMNGKTYRKQLEYDLYGWFDGSCGPRNPGGTAGWGIILKDCEGQTIHRAGGIVGSGPRMSNNVGEHFACANLLELIADLAGSGWKVLIRGDSKLVVNQISGRWKAKNGLYISEYRRGRAALQALDELGVFVRMAWVPREQNVEADEMSTIDGLSFVRRP